MSTFQTLLDSYGDLANRYANLEAERDALKARIAALEAERDALKGERDELEKEASGFAADYNEVFWDNVALKEEVERCEASIRFWKKGACDLLQELEER